MKYIIFPGMVALTVEPDDVGHTFYVSAPGWHGGMEELEVEELPCPSITNHVYVGRRTSEGPRVLKDGQELNLERSLAVTNHSPSGFEWGYGGSGPAQLALALLLEETEKEQALELYQRFKWKVVAELPWKLWQLTSQEIQDWLKTQVEAK